MSDAVLEREWMLMLPTNAHPAPCSPAPSDASVVNVPLVFTIETMASETIRRAREREFVARVSVKNRPNPSLDSRAQSCTSINLPMLDFRLDTEPETGHPRPVTNRTITVPIPAALMSDAAVLVTILATRDTDEGVVPSPACLLIRPTANYTHVGSVLFSLATFMQYGLQDTSAREHSYTEDVHEASKRTHIPTMSGHVYPVGTETCCERMEQSRDKARFHVHMTAELLPGMVSFAQLQSKFTFVVPDPSYMDMLADTDAISEIAHKMEEDEVARRKDVGASKACSVARRTYMRMRQEEGGLFVLPGFTFTFEPSLDDPRNISRATLEGLVGAVLVERELKQRILFHSGPDTPVGLREQLRVAPWLVPRATLFDLELSRLTQAETKEGRAEVNLVLVLLACRAVCLLSRYLLYTADTAVCVECIERKGGKKHRPKIKARSKRGAPEGARENAPSRPDTAGDCCVDDNDDLSEMRYYVAPSDFYGDQTRATRKGWSKGGHSGDCDDQQAPLARAYRFLRDTKMAFSHPLMDRIRAAIQGTTASTATVTAFAGKMGEQDGAACEPGTVDPETGIPYGIEGHMPAVVQHPEQNFILEGTCSYMPDHTMDPDPSTMNKLLVALQRADPLALVKLGIDTDAMMTYRSPNPCNAFYDCIGAVFGPDVHRTQDHGPEGKGRFPVSRAITYADPKDGGTQRMGVPLDMFLERSGAKSYKIRHKDVGYCTPRDMKLFTSLDVMGSGTVFPDYIQDDRLSGVVNAADFGLLPVEDTVAAKTIVRLVAGSAVLQKRIAEHGGDLETLPVTHYPHAFARLHFRADRTTEAWATELVRLMEKCECVAGLDVYLERVYEDLAGVVVVATVTGSATKIVG